MPDYQQGKIYKLISPHTDKIYVGSTTKQYLCQRLTEHKNKQKLWVNGEYHFVSSFDILALGDVEIILLESYACNTKDELTARERHWIEQNKEMVINKYVPNRKQKERNDNYYKNNKEQITIKAKDYYDSNKELIQQKHKTKYNCVCGSAYTYGNKQGHIKSDKHQTYLMIQTL
jgi:hypothetical protein